MTGGPSDTAACILAVTAVSDEDNTNAAKFPSLEKDEEVSELQLQHEGKSNSR